MLVLFSLTIFVGATLLFVVQPLFGRMALPLLGGAPAVWNTSMVFFQATLLAGYGYAHFISRRLPWRAQCVAHAALLVVAAVSLPMAAPLGATPPTHGTPVWWLLATAALMVGLPFLVVSATSPLLQRWFSLTRHPAARDPYFLYAASNLGSLLALLSYPLLIEPRLGVLRQSQWWAVGYGLLALLLAGCAGAVWRQRLGGPSLPAKGSGGSDAPNLPAEPVTARQRGRWLLLAFVPSSLLLSVTNYLSMDLAAIPLLWVIPLALYLLTFSLAFARRAWLSPAAVARLARLTLLLAVVTLTMRASDPLSVLLPLHLLTLFAAGLLCHGALAADRPAPRWLTEFYFWVALGGVLGGVFNALAAPLVFRSLVEYPLGLLLAAWVLPRDAAARWRRGDWLWPVALGAVAAALAVGVGRRPELGATALGQLLVFGLPAVWCFSFARRPRRFALGLVALLLAGGLVDRQQGKLLFAERSFFGIHRVVADARNGTHRLFHGTTVHGIQQRDPARRGEPLAYYARSGPVGQVFAELGEPLGARVAVIGLGAGGLAAYAEPGQAWTFYEIDPTVERVARDERLFTFLADCRAPFEVVLGDARHTLRAAPDQTYGLIVLDAYNSDAIPLHLITREAVALYARKLRPDGALVWHITNRHFDIEPALAALAADAGWTCWLRDDQALTVGQLAAGEAPSCWAVMTRSAAVSDRLATDPRWQPAANPRGLTVWTDDYANVLATLRLRW